jgi:hypothetical protein
MLPTAWQREYMADLKRETEAMLAALAVERAEQLKPLHVKIQDWHGSLPHPHRKPHYTMDELVQQFNMAPRFIGEALHKLGWQRKRKWDGGGPYGRYWIPPGEITAPQPTD